jgi:hypothetical protein
VLVFIDVFKLGTILATTHALNMHTRESGTGGPGEKLLFKNANSLIV